MEPNKLINFIDNYWEKSILKTFSDFIAIPCVSSAYDPEWQKNGYLQKTAELFANWAKNQNIKNLQCEIIKLENRGPFLYIDVKGDSDDTILFYGHLDKMPPSEGWDEGLGAWKPVIKNGKLFGRGSSDDGYAFFIPLTAIKALQEFKQPHARCVIIIESGEESGSPDLDVYLDHLKEKIGSPKLMFCLDTDCNDHDYLWCTTSIRGLIGGELSIEMLKTAVHSGASGGIVSSPFVILQNLLNRIQDAETGKILLKEVQSTLSNETKEQIKKATGVVGDKLYNAFPFTEGAKPITNDLVELMINRDWRCFMTITGIEGVPDLQHAANVILPKISLKLSMRIPPNANPQKVVTELKNVIETNPPFGAKIIFTPKNSNKGWNTQKFSSWLKQSLLKAGPNYTEKDIYFSGIGGAVPTVTLLGEKFPQADFANIGFGGSYSNCHGPNEFLPIQMAKNLNCVVAQIIADQFNS